MPNGDYGLLVRLRPIVAPRRLAFEVDGRELISAGFSVLATLDHPHWTVLVSEATSEQFARVRPLFCGPVENPAWAGWTGPVR
ncbi:MAG: hypothetical protein SGJ13_09215 [Actinomycetota bacterium]|nr:hypothetical protein [Actinomycetota bacterium]